MYLPIAATKQPQIAAAVDAVVAELAPAVRRINYEIAQDWSGQWGIFFKVLLSDEAASRSQLRNTATSVRAVSFADRRAVSKWSIERQRSALGRTLEHRALRAVCRITMYRSTGTARTQLARST